MIRITMLIIGSAALLLSASAQNSDVKAKLPLSYELYSWQTSAGEWRFSLLLSPSGPNVSAEQVFDAKVRLKSINELKHKISGLPSGCTIFWLGQIINAPTVNHKYRVGLPSSETIQDVRRYAEARAIRIELPINPTDKP